MVVTPLTFLGGAFYSIDMLPPLWQKITLFNPVVYLISGFRWSFYGVADVERGDQPRRDARLPGIVHRRRMVDLQDRLQAQELSNANVRRRTVAVPRTAGLNAPAAERGQANRIALKWIWLS